MYLLLRSVICFSHTLLYDACLLYSKQYLAHISKVGANMMPSRVICSIFTSRHLGGLLAFFVCDFGAIYLMLFQICIRFA